MSQTVEQQIDDLRKELSELKAAVLKLKPRKNDWRSTVGTLVDDKISREADRLGTEYRVRESEP